jgi:hypothetical protein
VAFALLGLTSLLLGSTGCSRNAKPLLPNPLQPGGPALLPSRSPTPTPSPTPVTTAGLAAPSNLVGTVVSPTSLQLSWRDNSNNESDFVVAGATETEGPRILGTALANVPSFLVVNLVPGRRYFFQVAARNAAGISQSPILPFQMPFVPPTAPANLTARATSPTTVDLSWNAAANHAGYQVFRAANQEPLTLHATLPETALNTQITGLVADTEYRFQVVAVNPTFNAPSTVVSVRTLQPPPGAPTNVVATALSPSAIRVSWASAPYAAEYRVHLAVGDGAFAVHRTVGAAVLSVDVPELSPVTRYRFRVEARNATASTPSLDAQATTLWPLPTAPVNFDVSTTDNTGRSIRATWSPGTFVQSYHVYVGRGLHGALEFRTALTPDVNAYVLSVATPGLYRVVVFSVNPSGNAAAEARVRTRTRPLIDYDGDGRSEDRALFRPTDSVFRIVTSNGTSITQQHGAINHDVPVPGDYDGDGRTDIAVFRPSNATWYILRSRDGARAQQFGAANHDRPVQADFDGDGADDIAVFRPSNATWYIIPATTGAGYHVQWGAPNLDIPVPADYDGDGRADIAVFRRTDATWHILRSKGGTTVQQFGGANSHLPVPADFDGDGRADIAVFQPDNGANPSRWHILGSLTGYRSVDFGRRNFDLPIPADYDGDGRADVAVFRRNVDNQTSRFLILGSTAGSYFRDFGAPNSPVPLALPTHHGPQHPRLPDLGTWLRF